MPQIILLLIFILKINALPYDCATFTPLGCNGCIVNFESITNGCVWCGSVDDNGNSPSGNCYNYSVISNACQNNYYEDATMQSYQCCSSTFRIGSNTELMCSSNYASQIQSINFNIMIIFIGYFWSMGFLSVFFSHYFYMKDYCLAFYYGVTYPYYFIKLFFIDI